MTDQTIIRLGAEGRQYCDSSLDGVTLLGTLQEGQAIGALAQRTDGRYVQLNGDFERELDTDAVEAMLARQGWQRSTAESSGSVVAPVVVTIKRRRVPVMPQS